MDANQAIEKAKKRKERDGYERYVVFDSEWREYDCCDEIDLDNFYSGEHIQWDTLSDRYQ